MSLIQTPLGVCLLWTAKTRLGWLPTSCPDCEESYHGKLNGLYSSLPQGVSAFYVFSCNRVQHFKQCAAVIEWKHQPFKFVAILSLAICCKSVSVSHSCYCTCMVSTAVVLLLICVLFSSSWHPLSCNIAHRSSDTFLGSAAYNAWHIKLYLN